jgi:hypothetical protein
MRSALITCALLLAACGADAPPRHGAASPGVTVGGEILIGVKTNL